MSNWMPDVELDPIMFDGDVVNFKVKRLLVEDMNLVTQNYDRISGTLKFSGPEEMSALAARIVPKYVREVRGLKKADGTLFQLEEFKGVIAEYYFAPLVGSLFAALMSASIVKEDEAKNSVAPPPAQ
jgi:hypothetical protein